MEQSALQNKISDGSIDQAAKKNRNIQKGKDYFNQFISKTIRERCFAKQKDDRRKQLFEKGNRKSYVRREKKVFFVSSPNPGKDRDRERKLDSKGTKKRNGGKKRKKKYFA